MTLDAIIFDVEGTLIDCVGYVLDSWQDTLAAAGLGVRRQELQRHSGMDGGDMLDRLLPEPERARKKHLLETQGKLYRRAYLPLARPFPGVQEMIGALKEQRYRFAIATTCSSDELRSYNEKMAVLAPGDVVTCGDDVRKGKPHPDLFYQTLQKLGAPEPSRVLAVGDTPFDAMAAKSLGIRALGVLTGGFSAEDLLSAGCETVLPGVKEIRDHLNR